MSQIISVLPASNRRSGLFHAQAESAIRSSSPLSHQALRASLR